MTKSCTESELVILNDSVVIGVAELKPAKLRDRLLGQIVNDCDADCALFQMAHWNYIYEGCCVFRASSRLFS